MKPGFYHTYITVFVRPAPLTAACCGHIDRRATWTTSIKLALRNGNKYVEPEDPQPDLETGKELKMRKLFAEVEEIRDMIDKLQANVEEVKRKHSAILMAQNAEERKEELEYLQDDNREIINKTRVKLCRMQQSSNMELKEQSIKVGADGSNLNRLNDKATLKMAITQHAALWHKFVEVVAEYRGAQADYCDRCENQMIRQLLIINPNVAEQDLHDLLKQNKLYLFTDAIIKETQQEKQTLANVEARYADIIKLETSIKELNDMYIEMAIFIEAQGEMINRIEFNVNNCAENIEKGLDEVEQAAAIVNRGRWKKFISACFLIVLLDVGRRARQPVFSWLRTSFGYHF